MTALGVAWAQARAQRPARPARTPVLLLLVAWVGAHLPAWSKVRTNLLQFTAFGFLSYAGFQHSVIAGCITVGVSLLIIEALPDNTRPRR